MRSYLPTDEKHIHVYGRCVKTVPMPVFWTAGGIEFVTNSSGAYLDIEAQYTTSEVWLEVEMNGRVLQHMIVMPGRNRICLFRGYYENERKLMRVRMVGQPNPDDNKKHLLIHELFIEDGELEPVQPKKMNIEFVGDSLTSGEGLTGGTEINSWCGGIFGLAGHYGLKVAEHFDADYSIVSQCGWGVCSGWDNNANNVIPPYYTQICGVVNGELNRRLGAFCEHDFEAWKADVVVINLGTNDGGALNQPAWQDPETGISYKMSMDADGILDAASRERFEKAVTDFLTAVRKNNPGAQILWVYGMCDHVMEKYIVEAVDEYIGNTGDGMTHYLSLPAAAPGSFGSHGHPGIPVHAAAAQVITDYIEKIRK